MAIRDPEIAGREPALKAQETESRLQVALAAAGLGTWHWDIRSDLGTRDAAFNRLLGLDPRPTVGPLRDFLDHVHPEDLGTVMEALDRAVRTRQPYAAEHRVVWPDGSVHWLRDRGRILNGPDGQPAAFAGAAMDVTELRHSEEARARLGAVFESSEDAICTKSLEGRVTAWNAAAERMFGYTAAELVGQVFSVPRPPDCPDDVTPAVKAVLRGERIRPFETQRLHKDGRRIHVSVSISAIRDPGGRIFGVAFISRDITERRRAEEALRVSEERFRLASEAISGLIYDWDPVSGRVQRSQGLFTLLGYWPEEVKGEVDWWRRQVHADDVERVNQTILAALAGDGSFFSIEFRLRRRDGSWIHVWDKGLIVRDREGKATRVVGSTVDVTERRRSQEALERAHRELQEAVETKDRFLATLSHELRTPLTPVLAILSRLTADPRSAPFAGDFAMIQRNVELEARLIDDLLDLTRIARGKLELHRREIDARRVIEHALATAERDLEDRGLRLDVRLTAQEHRIWADGPRLTQVLWNLLSNAVKFTPPGGTVTVESALVSGPAGLRELVVTVRDTGIGIEPGVLPRIFEAFEQTDRSISRRFGGPGLGLAVSRAIVDLHGGGLTAESQGRGTGACFTVRLPVAAVQGDLDETGVWFSRSRPAAAAPFVASTEPEPSLHILLVEDHEDTAGAMTDLLRLMGHEVTVAASVAAALAAAGASRDGVGRPLDLVVSDLGLPDGSGQDLMRELTQRYGLRGIALSGYGMEEDVRRSHEAGFLRHLTKPVDLQMLRAAIQEAVGKG
ncbi:MAG TPA: PAS domain-containing protein [Thermoanaerobaculia bacterium]|nr:PAS domain-containing protein [Thermoanaerobaculia bacterium]